MEQRKSPISVPPVLDSDAGRNGFPRNPIQERRRGFVQPHRPEQAYSLQGNLRCVISEELKCLGASAMLLEMAKVLAYVHPESKGDTVYFDPDGIILGSKKIGDLSLEIGSVKARIWFHNLGYPIGSLPPEDFQKFFKLDFRRFEALSASASYLVMMGLHAQGQSHLGLFFYNDYEKRLPEYFSAIQQ